MMQASDYSGTNAQVYGLSCVLNLFHTPSGAIASYELASFAPGKGRLGGLCFKENKACRSFDICSGLKQDFFSPIKTPVHRLRRFAQIKPNVLKSAQSVDKRF